MPIQPKEAKRKGITMNDEMTEAEAKALRDVGIEPNEWLVKGASYAEAEDGSIVGVNAITVFRPGLFSDMQQARRETMEHLAQVQKSIEIDLAGE